MSTKRSKTFPVTVKQEIEEVSEDKRTTSLFPAVFECLIKFNEERNQFFNVDVDNQMTTFVEDKVWKFSLGLRLVCSDWNDVIEQYYTTTHYPLINQSRVIKIHGKDTTEVDSYIKFFCKFGQKVELISIKIFDFYDNTMVGLYLLIQQLIKNLKMLKHLFIFYKTTDHNYYNHIEQLEDTIKLYPCPKFEKLESVNVVGWLSNQIINELIQKGCNLTSLRQISPGDQFVGLNYSTIFSNLQELEITIESNYDFQQFKQFGKTWKLKKLYGNFSNLLDKENWLDIFQVLENNWSSSLESLCIWLPKMKHRKGYQAQISRYTQCERLNLPQFKTIKLWTTIPIALDFLLPSRGCLESIQVNWIELPKELDEPTELYYEVMDCQKVEHLGSESEMEKSNIWGWFVNLQWVKSVGDKVHRPAKFGVPLNLV